MHFGKKCRPTLATKCARIIIIIIIIISIYKAPGICKTNRLLSVERGGQYEWGEP